jgi:deoxycytidylate deaminase
VKPQTELVIGLVEAVGTDLGLVSDELRTELSEYDYSTEVIRLSEYLQDLPWAEQFGDRPEDERMWLAMDAGTRLRIETQHGDALALWAISDIFRSRENEAATKISDGQEEHAANLDRRAWILRSLKTPDEVTTLRAVYGSRFFLFAAYSPEERRKDNLEGKIRHSRGTKEPSDWRYKPDQLIQRDRDENLRGGQDVENTFHQADFFLDASTPAALREDVERSLEILFGHPFRTPTKDEFAQFQARGAALRSGELGRQVGAAVATPDGSVVALGSNEVPTAGGGAHWEEDGPGNREFEVSEIDTNLREQERIARELAEALRERLEHILQEADPERRREIAASFGTGLEKQLLDEKLRDLTEFGRAVHAEMDALLDAARRGISVLGCTLHVTTFPCHNCARHIIGVGITRVVFVEPYSKSRALELHSQDIALGGPNDGMRVSFEPFRGVAPRRYLELFDLRARERAGQRRKDDEGRVQAVFDKRNAHPLFADLEPEPFRPELPAYRRRELMALASFEELSEQLTKGQDVPTDASGKKQSDQGEAAT